MPAKQTDRVWTREEVLALPDDGNRYELVDGELLVMPSPRMLHQDASSEIEFLLRQYVNEHGIGKMHHAPADLELRSGQVVQPDIFVSSLVDGRRAREWSEVGIPLLIVEVLSPKYERHDREVKRALYQRLGVPTYWIVDLDARAVEVWTPNAIRPLAKTTRLEWRPNSAIAPLEVDLVRFFSSLE